MYRSTTRCGRLSVLAGLLVSASTHGQQIIEIGTAQGANSPQDYPAPYGNFFNGARHQILFLASELNAAGMAEGFIYSAAFNVFTIAGAPLQSFTMSIGQTAVNEAGPGWVTGLTPVWGPQTYTETAGWNTHTFDAPFYWDGISNLMLETCFSNATNTFNAQTFYSLTPFNSVLYRSTFNPNVCTATMGTLQPSALRPDVRFEWSSPQIPPVAGFAVSSAFSCDGAIQFTDLTANDPTGWFWDFGDDSTSTEQDPFHQYANDGVYTVVLIDTNAYGADTATAEVTVNMNGPQPIPACPLTSPGTIAGFGILQVSYGDIVYPSADAVAEGYADRGCVVDTVSACSQFDLEVTTGQVTTHNVRAWIDWDNNGVFSVNEEVLSANGVLSASAVVTIPSGAVLDTPLRLRVMADYDFSPPPQPCVDPQFGQAEDYGLVVIANPLPPASTFSAEPLTTCTGTVQFTDETLNCPTGWIWDFGDLGGSSDQDPLHTYATSGTYTVTLITINANGSDTLVLTDLITVDLAGQLPAAACTPQTLSYCCGYGILAFDFAGINSTSPDGVEGYQDRSCGNVATVEEGTNVFVDVTTGDQNPHDVYMWFDLDNDGDFSAAELVWTALNDVSPSAFITIPQGVLYNTPLRLRLSTDVIGGNITASACYQPQFGQTEDFTVIVTPNTAPPNALFTANPQQTCDGLVQFTDLSQNLPTSWLWNFGDTQTSPDQNPLHQYLATGTYTVSLTATNVNGSDTQTIPGMIQVVDETFCDTTSVPNTGNVTMQECYGVVSDDGGTTGNYSPGVSGTVTITPPGAQWVTLTFQQFEWETNFDFLRLFDGPNEFSPMIGEYSGSGVGVLPNGGVISSTGPSLTIQQAASNGPITWEGFVANWSCSYTGIAEQDPDPFAGLWPQPAHDRLNIGLRRPAGINWDLAVLDPLGRIAYTEAISAGSELITLDLNAWPAGCYALMLTTPDHRWTRTIVVR